MPDSHAHIWVYDPDEEVYRCRICGERWQPAASLVQQIITKTAAVANVSETDLVGPSRKQPLARWRQIAMYLCRENTDLSLPKIGARFGGRDHTTVIHAIKKIRHLMAADKQVYDQVTTLTQQLAITEVKHD